MRFSARLGRARPLENGGSSQHCLQRGVARLSRRLSLLAADDIGFDEIDGGLSDETSFGAARADEAHLGLSLVDLNEELTAADAQALEEIEAVIAEWQEAEAIADTSGAPPDSAQQRQMMARWRRLLNAKEAALRATGRAKLEGWVPAHLCGWFDPSAPIRDDDDDVGGDFWAKAASRSFSHKSDEADAADVAEDAEFAYEWQCLAERSRQDAAEAMKTADVSTGLAVLLDAGKWQRRRTSESAQECAIGIDLGTTNCGIAVSVNGVPSMVRLSDDDSNVFPSCVSYVGAGEVDAFTPLVDSTSKAGVLVGERARRQQVMNGDSTFSSVKRLIGRTATAEELRRLAALELPYRRAGSGEVLLACPSLRRTLSAVDLSAELVRHALTQAEAYLERNITRAVVTVPAYFGHAEREATETACLIAGLKEVQLLREPEAAALLYALSARNDERVMVFDLGGGTFDISIVDVGGSVVEVIATSGDPRLGGDDWDAALTDWLCDTFAQEHGVRLTGFARRRVLDAAVEAKHVLSTTATTQVEVPFLYGDLGLNVTLSRRKFEALCRHLLLRLVPPLLEVAQMAGIDVAEDIGTLRQGDASLAPERVRRWQQRVAWRWQRMQRKLGSNPQVQRFPVGVPVSKVLLVGGASRMPCIGRFIKRMTGLQAKPSLHPEEAVALGAAVQAAVLEGQINKRVLNPFFKESFKELRAAAEAGRTGAARTGVRKGGA